MDREKLLLESAKWWASHIAEAASIEDIEFISDQIRHAKYEIDSERKEAQKLAKVPND